MDSVFCIGNSRVVFDPLFELLVPKTAAADRAAEDNAHLSAQLGITVRRQLAAGRLLVCVRDPCVLCSRWLSGCAQLGSRKVTHQLIRSSEEAIPGIAAGAKIFTAYVGRQTSQVRVERRWRACVRAFVCALLHRLNPHVSLDPSAGPIQPRHRCCEDAACDVRQHDSRRANHGRRQRCVHHTPAFGLTRLWRLRDHRCSWWRRRGKHVSHGAVHRRDATCPPRLSRHTTKSVVVVDASFCCRTSCRHGRNITPAVRHLTQRERHAVQRA